MYPHSLLQWVFGSALVMVALGVIGWVVILLDGLYERHIQKRHGAPRDDEEGRTAVWLVFEALSAIFVVTGLLVAIYSDSAVLRAVAGIAMIVLVAAVTWAVLDEGDK